MYADYLNCSIIQEPMAPSDVYCLPFLYLNGDMRKLSYAKFHGIILSDNDIVVCRLHNKQYIVDIIGYVRLIKQPMTESKCFPGFAKDNNKFQGIKEEDTYETFKNILSYKIESWSLDTIFRQEDFLQEFLERFTFIVGRPDSNVMVWSDIIGKFVFYPIEVTKFEVPCIRAVAMLKELFRDTTSNFWDNSECLWWNR